MRIHLPALATAALLVGTPLAAQDTSSAAPPPRPPRLRGVARLGAEFGGDKVLEFQYEDGTTPDVTAGGGLAVSLGAVVQAEWAFRALVLDARYTAMQYRIAGSDETVDASNVGLGVAWFFGGRGSR